MTPSDLDALEKLLAAATPGLWRLNNEPIYMARHDNHQVLSVTRCEIVASDIDNDADAEVIVALRNHAPALLAAAREAERLRAFVAVASLARLRGSFPQGSAMHIDADAILAYVKALEEERDELDRLRAVAWDTVREADNEAKVAIARCAAMAEVVEMAREVGVWRSGDHHNNNYGTRLRDALARLDATEKP